MSMLLVIRSVRHVKSAVEQASDYLIHYRRYACDPCQRDTLLGIWIRRRIDADLPMLLFRGERVQGDGRPVDDPREDYSPEAPVGVRTSWSLSGLWSLCWLDGPALRENPSPHQRRRQVLDHLVQGAQRTARTPGAFRPVFDHTDAHDIVNANLAELRSRYAHLIAAHWYIDNPEHGIAGPYGTTRDYQINGESNPGSRR